MDTDVTDKSAITAKTAIRQCGRDRVKDLRGLFLALHAHERAVSPLPLADDETAWRERLLLYEAWFEQDRALLHLAESDGHAVGYAFTVLHDGTNDTFYLAPRYAEVRSLSVAPDHRNAGVGTRLLDAVDRALAELSISSLAIAVTVGNDDALRFYTRRGLVPGEVMLYRLTSDHHTMPSPALIAGVPAASWQEHREASLGVRAWYVRARDVCRRAHPGWPAR